MGATLGAQIRCPWAQTHDAFTAAGASATLLWPLTANDASIRTGEDATEAHHGHINQRLEANWFANGVGGWGATLREPLESSHIWRVARNLSRKEMGRI